MFNLWHFFALLGFEDRGLNCTKFSMDASDRRHIIFIGDGPWRKDRKLVSVSICGQDYKGGGGAWGTSF